jgi:hypothetical protein
MGIRTLAMPIGDRFSAMVLCGVRPAGCVWDLSCVSWRCFPDSNARLREGDARVGGWQQSMTSHAAVVGV